MVPCSLPTYDVRIQDISPGYQSRANVAPLEMMLYAPRGKMVVRSEYVIYDLGSLVGEVGGMAGILLGVSCVMVYDSIKVAAKRVLSFGKKKNIDLVIERA